MRPRNILTTALVLLAVGAARAQAPSEQRLQELSRVHARASLDEFRQLLGLPNDAHFPENVRRNVDWATRAFRARGFSTETLETGGPPLLLAERRRDGADRAVMIYAHMDGQPVQPDKWDQDDPYGAVLKEHSDDGWRPISWESLDGQVDPDWRIYARSVADDKGPIMMLLAALDAMHEAGLESPFNLKVVLDFEEEMGSPHLPAAVGRHRDRLSADWLWILDGPRHPSNRPTVVFGARGIATMTLTVFGPARPQHSGHYGNWAPNPAERLAQLLGSMEDRDGRVTIPGFYDGIELDKATRDMLAQTPEDEAAIERELGFAEPEHVADTYQQALQYPSLSVLGLSSGWVGEQTRTIIPASATAELDLRLVKENDPERLIGLIRDYITQRGWHLIDGREPSTAERAKYPRIASFSSRIAYGAFRTPYDSPIGSYATAAMTRAFGKAPVRVRTTGGSVPISPFVRELGVPAIIIPAANADDDQHSPNENLRLGNYYEGVLQYLSLLMDGADLPQASR